MTADEQETAVEHDPSLEDTTDAFLKRVGLHREVEPEKAHRIEHVAVDGRLLRLPGRPSTWWPSLQHLDISVTAALFAMLTAVLFVVFIVTSTFPESVKWLCLCAEAAVITWLLLIASLWLRGRE